MARSSSSISWTSSRIALGAFAAAAVLIFSFPMAMVRIYFAGVPGDPIAPALILRVLVYAVSVVGGAVAIAWLARSLLVACLLGALYSVIPSVLLLFLGGGF